MWHHFTGFALPAAMPKYVSRNYYANVLARDPSARGGRVPGWCLQGREAHKASSAGKGKWEVFRRKKGKKKLVIVYDEQTEEVFVITGTEG